MWHCGLRRLSSEESYHAGRKGHLLLWDISATISQHWSWGLVMFATFSRTGTFSNSWRKPPLGLESRQSTSSDTAILYLCELQPVTQSSGVWVFSSTKWEQ